MRVFTLLLCGVYLLFGQTPANDYGICNTIKIKYEKSQHAEYNTNKDYLKLSDSKEKLVVTVTDLNTKLPKMLGNNPLFPHGQLVYISGDILGETFYLIEQNSFKNIFLMTIFPKQMKVILHKQYVNNDINEKSFDIKTNGFYATMMFGSYSCEK
jgi:hypothetical protein